MDILNIGLGFLEGIALILSPCILPILPIIFAGSLTGSKKRPIGIIIGFIITFSLFTFFSRSLVAYSGIDTNIIRYVSYILLAMLGIIMISTFLTDKFNTFTQRLANVGTSLTMANNPQGGFISGCLFGGLVAIIWTPCAGPILAAIIVQIATQKSSLTSFLTLLAFGIGAAVPMLIIALLGRQLLDKLHFLKSHTIFFRKLLGIIILLSVIYMVFFAGTITTIASPRFSQQATSLENGLTQAYPAPPIEQIDAWINSKPLQINQLQGKVVLIDFWTYSCINCIRTLPYLKDWYQKYHDKGLVIIGIHSPEFEFEKNITNVKNAVIDNKIGYPVALDNHFATWQNFNNHYWPAQYLIDQHGYVVYTHFGEGDDDITENNIRYLLDIKEPTTLTKTKIAASSYQTPETYLGYLRADSFANFDVMVKNQRAHYTFPKTLLLNTWALSGDWTILPDKIIAMSPNAAIRINFFARKVFIVTGTTSHKAVNISLLLDGNPITIQAGKDVTNSSIHVDQHRLYDLLTLDQLSNHILQLTASAPGLEVYTFTFGD